MKAPPALYVCLLAILVTAVLVFYFFFAALMGWELVPGDERDNSLLPTPVESRLAPAPAAAGRLAATHCGRCGVVESVRKVGAAANAASAGAAAGGMTGTIIGLQTAGRHGGDLLAAVGALLGAMVGTRYEDRARAAGVYEIAIRYEDGSSRVLTVLGEPAWKAGDSVRIIGGRIWPDA